MINLLYLDDDNNVIEEIEEINIEKDYKLDKLYFVVDNYKDKVDYFKEKLQMISIDVSDIHRSYDLNHSEHSANTFYETNEQNFILIRSSLIEHITLKCQNKIENLFHALKDDKTLSEFLEKRTFIIEKKENTLKIINQSVKILDILNNIQLLKDYDTDLDIIK